MAQNGARRAVVGADAALTNWDGHFAVESVSTATCCSPFLHHSRRGIGVNGYAATLATTPRSRRHLKASNLDNGEEEVAPDEKEVVDRGAPNEVMGRDTPDVETIGCDEPDNCRGANKERNRSDSISSTDTHGPKGQNVPGGWRRKRSGDYCSSPNRSVISDVGRFGSIGSGGIGGISRLSSSRLAMSGRQTLTGSSLLGDSMTEIVIEDLQNEHEPTSALLDYCKRKFLRPYVAILSLVGLNPVSTDTTCCRTFFSYLQAFLVLVVLLLGYFLQYLTLYRGDRGFSNYRKIFPEATPPVAGSREGTVRTIGELFFGYVIANALHLLGFTSAVIVCKVVDNEQLQNLIERVFLMSMKPRRLCRMLWLCVFLGFVFLGLLFAYVTPSVLMQTQIVRVKWFIEPMHNWQLTTKIGLLATIFVQDLVEITIITTYCIECYLLRVHLATLSHKLLMHSIESLDWMREVLEFRKLLDHLNQRLAVPVCFFTVMNLSYAFAGVVYLFNDFDFHYSAIKVVILNIINVLLWLIMGLVPFFMAASVTRVCQAAQENGHHIRVRPFVYHNTSAEDLNSTLLFTSSLNMSAKLFRMPIQPNYLCFAILVISVVIITLGMCLNLSTWGTE